MNENKINWKNIYVYMYIRIYDENINNGSSMGVENTAKFIDGQTNGWIDGWEFISEGKKCKQYIRWEKMEKNRIDGWMDG